MPNINFTKKSFFTYLKKDHHDLMLDAYGCNPYSPVWICGMEFGGGNNYFSELYKRYILKHSACCMSSLYNNESEADEYSLISSALVGCLTDQQLLTKYQNCHNDGEKIKKLVSTWYQKNRVFCWGGQGFRMNAGVLSLPNHSAWNEDSRIYKDFDKSDFLSLEQFTGCKSINVYRNQMLDVFSVHVLKRLQQYRPKLLICTGKSAWWEFKKLFHDDLVLKSRKNISLPKGKNDRSTYVELHYYEPTDTHVLLMNFITDRRPSTIGLTDVGAIAEDLREELPWLKTLESIKSFDNLKRAEFLDNLYYKIGNRQAFVESPEITEFIKQNREQACQELNSELKAVRPDYAVFGEITDPVALFQALRVVSLRDDSLYEELANLMLNYYKEEQANILSKTIDDMRSLIKSN